MPTEPQDQFAGAEESVDQQRLDALNTVAQFGRRGLEQAIEHKRQITSANPVSNAALEPYRAVAGRTASLLEREGQATQAVQGNYFDQVKEAMPLYRQNASDIVSTYRNAYEKREADRQHQLAMEAEQQRQAAATLAALQATAVAPQAPAPEEVQAQPDALDTTITGLLDNVMGPMSDDQRASLHAAMRLSPPGTPAYEQLRRQFPFLPPANVAQAPRKGGAF